jgi:hypothetical protein
MVAQDILNLHDSLSASTTITGLSGGFNLSEADLTEDALCQAFKRTRIKG